MVDVVIEVDASVVEWLKSVATASGESVPDVVVRLIVERKSVHDRHMEHVMAHSKSQFWEGAT